MLNNQIAKIAFLSHRQWTYKMVELYPSVRPYIRPSVRLHFHFYTITAYHIFFDFPSCGQRIWSKIKILNCYSVFIIKPVDSILHRMIWRCTIAAYQIFFNFRSCERGIRPNVKVLICKVILIIEPLDFKLHRMIPYWRPHDCTI